MPRQDGTGPTGTGPIGRGMGPCGRGKRFVGRSFGRGWRFWSNPSKDDEKTQLEQELKNMDADKKEIEKRLKELNNE